jgi:hypothetical protein
MRNGYDDILERIPNRPKWWDERGVPRYCDFVPREVANIYADERVLLMIACQDCGHQFKVAMTSSLFDRAVHAIQRNPNSTPDEIKKQLAPTLAEQIRDGSIHYGDPPAYFGKYAEAKEGGACCHSGATMNCIDLKVLEYWRRGDSDKGEAWDTRDAAFEIDLPGGADGSVTPRP